MIEVELKLWERHETSRKELILFYLPVVDRLAKSIARSTGRANWEDLRQDGIIGLMKAIIRFNPDQGVPFRAFAKSYIRGAIFDSAELTRDMTRRQDEIYRKIRRAENELTKKLQRNPTIDEIKDETKLTHEQILNAMDARGVAFADEFPDQEEAPASEIVENLRPDKAILIEEACSHLSEIEQSIVRLHYLDDLSYEKIAEKLGIIPVEVTKTRQRAIGKVAKICQRALKKLRKLLDVEGKGEHDEE